jgi:hypothetical protein
MTNLTYFAHTLRSPTQVLRLYTVPSFSLKPRCGGRYDLSTETARALFEIAPQLQHLQCSLSDKDGILALCDR